MGTIRTALYLHGHVYRNKHKQFTCITAGVAVVLTSLYFIFKKYKDTKANEEPVPKESDVDNTSNEPEKTIDQEVVESITKENISSSSSESETEPEQEILVEKTDENNNISEPVETDPATVELINTESEKDDDEKIDVEVVAVDEVEQKQDEPDMETDTSTKITDTVDETAEIIVKEVLAETKPDPENSSDEEVDNKSVKDEIKTASQSENSSDEDVDNKSVKVSVAADVAEIKTSSESGSSDDEVDTKSAVDELTKQLIAEVENNEKFSDDSESPEQSELNASEDEQN